MIVFLRPRVWFAELSRNEAGYTMAGTIQLLVIVGLLVGLFLMGGEIKNKANVIMTISRVKGYDAATRSFRNSYGALPGDIRTPNRLPNCTVQPCATPGNGDTIIADRKSLVSSPFYFRDNSENRTYWLHLAVTKLISDVKSDGSKSKYFGQWGIEFPSAPIGVAGGFHIAYYSVTATAFNSLSLLGHYAVLRGSTDTYGVTASPYALTPKVSAAIDKKIDDGKPLTGRVIGVGSQMCSANNIYTEATAERACNLLFQLSF